MIVVDQSKPIQELAGLVRAQPKNVTIHECWSASFNLATHSVGRFEDTITVSASLTVPLDDANFMTEEAWQDVEVEPNTSAIRGRIGTLVLLTPKREDGEPSVASSPTLANEAANHSEDGWTSFPIELPVEQLKSQFEKDGARYEHDARTVISIDAQRGDLRPIQVVANLSTEIDYFVFLADIFKDGRLPDSVARTMTAYMRKPEAERGEHRLLLRTTVRTERPLKEVTIKYFSIDWPFASDGADVLLTTVSASAHSAPNIDEKKYRFIRNSSNSTIEVGNIKLAFDDDSEGKNGRREFGIVLRFANAQMQADMPNLKMQMVLEMPGSILGITPVFADWSGKIVSKPGSKSKVEMKQSTSARLQIEVNTRHIFESQHYTFRYRLRLRGVEINSERMQYIKQILAERNLAVRAEGLGTSREEGRQVGTREWLVVAERPVQGDPLILTTLVQCETQEVLRLRGSDLDRFQGQDISANTVVDVLGVLRGRREDLMKEVNAYVRELRHQLGRFAGRG